MKKPKLMAVDFDRESWPYFYYQKIAAMYDPMWINLPIDPGYYYGLQRVNAGWSSENSNLPGLFAAPIKIEAFLESGNKWLQLIPFDLSLISSPGESGIQVDLTNAARPMTATPLNRSDRHNVLYRFRDVLTVKISGFTVIASPPAPDFSLPAYIDLLLMGRLYPAKELPGWGEGESA